MAAMGFTLPELLVGLGLGLTVLAMALSVWQTTHQAWLGLNAAMQLQDNARQALQAVVTQAELAESAQLVAVAAHAGFDAIDDSAQPDVSATDRSKGGDLLVLSHWRSLDPTDCQGNTSGSQAWVRNQFQRSTSTPNDWACKDLLATGSTFQALAEGVEDMQVMFAEVNANGSGLQWKTPAQISAWTRVVALEICLRMVSATRLTAARNASVGCQGEPVPADDRLRWVVRRMVRLPAHAPWRG